MSAHGVRRVGVIQRSIERRRRPAAHRGWSSSHFFSCLAAPTIIRLSRFPLHLATSAPRGAAIHQLVHTSGTDSRDGARVDDGSSSLKRVPDQRSWQGSRSLRDDGTSGSPGRSRHHGRSHRGVLPGCYSRVATVGCQRIGGRRRAGHSGSWADAHADARRKILRVPRDSRLFHQWSGRAHRTRASTRSLDAACDVPCWSSVGALVAASAVVLFRRGSASFVLPTSWVFFVSCRARGLHCGLHRRDLRRVEL